MSFVRRMESSMKDLETVLVFLKFGGPLNHRVPHATVSPGGLPMLLAPWLELQQ